MKILVSHPTGNANVRAVLTGFMNSGMLQSFYTTVAAFPGEIIYKLGGIGALSEIRRRTYDPGIADITFRRPFFEAGRLLASRLNFKNLIRHEEGRFSIDAVCRDLDLFVSKSFKSKTKPCLPDAVYCYEDCALQTFAAATELGLQCNYDLPIGYWRAAHKIFQDEKEKWPEWAPTLSGLMDSREKLDQKDEELLLASNIFVASSFTKKTLEDFQGSLPESIVIPYGFPPPYKQRQFDNKKSGKLKLLFVGGLSQRKGIANLFEAVKDLTDHIELTVVGHKPSQPCPALDSALAAHKWIPSLPHEKVLELMRGNDVFVFPSLFEGFGLVITEAMSQGTPVITTERTCGPDFIKSGENGWIVEAGSTEELKASIEHCINNKEEIISIGQAAMQTAADRPWSAYGISLVNNFVPLVNRSRT